MASAINASNPVAISPTTSSVRANFAAAKAEIEELQGLVDALEVDVQALQDVPTPGASRTFGTVETAGRTLTVNDLTRTILYASESDSNFTIPLDSELGYGASQEGVFRILQLSVGKPVFISNGTTVINKATDVPPAVQYATHIATRYGTNLYVGTSV